MAEGQSSLGRYAAITGAAIGVIAAGAAAGVLAERKVVARKRSQDPEPFGSVRGDLYTVVAEDGLELYAEIDEPDRKPRRHQPTLVFVHGYALNLDCWHFQRLALRGRYRMVFFDQRSHGRSPRSEPTDATIDVTGGDLAAVLDQLVPRGPIVLIGHSMGGMSIMALAEQHPDWFSERITGVALIATSAGDFSAAALGLPGLPGRLLHRVAPSVIATLARTPRLVESSRKAGSDFGFVLTRRLAFGGTVPQEYVDFTDEMLAGTPFEVIADFFPGFSTHDKAAALATLADVPTAVVGGTLDQITPIAHTRRIAGLLPTATLLEVPGAGHMILLEKHDEVTAAIESLVERAERR